MHVRESMEGAELPSGTKDSHTVVERNRGRSPPMEGMWRQVVARTLEVVTGMAWPEWGTVSQMGS